MDTGEYRCGHSGSVTVYSRGVSKQRELEREFSQECPLCAMVAAYKDYSTRKGVDQARVIMEVGKVARRRGIASPYAGVKNIGDEGLLEEFLDGNRVAVELGGNLEITPDKSLGLQYKGSPILHFYQTVDYEKSTVTMSGSHKGFWVDLPRNTAYFERIESVEPVVEPVLDPKPVVEPVLEPKPIEPVVEPVLEPVARGKGWIMRRAWVIAREMAGGSKGSKSYLSEAMKQAWGEARG